MCVLGNHRFYLETLDQSTSNVPYRRHVTHLVGLCAGFGIRYDCTPSNKGTDIARLSIFNVASLTLLAKRK